MWQSHDPFFDLYTYISHEVRSPKINKPFITVPKPSSLISKKAAIPSVHLKALDADKNSIDNNQKIPPVKRSVIGR